MTGAAIAIWVTIAVLALSAMVVVLGYNRLVVLRNRASNAWSQIDVQLRRRHDLIPNLVEVCRGYMAHERQTLEAVTAARARAIDAREGVGGVGGVGRLASLAVTNELLTAEMDVTGALGNLLGRVEAYPNLKADALAARLFDELATTENRIAFARQAYNDAVMFYSAYRQGFPVLLYAGLFGFGELAFWRVESDAVRAVPQARLA